MKSALIFPGQGSQFAGMGQDFYRNFPEARELFQRASDALGEDIAKICFEGPEEELKKTRNTQPALLIVEYVIYSLFRRQFDGFSAAAGHSLGEYTALLAAGVFSFEDAVRTVRKRGEFMSTVTNGSLVACMGMDDGEIMDLCRELSSDGVIAPALFNAPGQVVIAGEVPLLQRFIDKTTGRQGVKATMLNVSGPFHCSLLNEAAANLERFLEDIDMKSPGFKVVANVTAQPAQDISSIRENLVRQVSHPVQWTKCVEYLKHDGYNTLVEIGPGKVLRGLCRKIDKQLRVINVEKVEDLDKASREMEELGNSTALEKEA
ncbi:MAG: ACP S-malonyltransferase [Candidatus Wallbacteria bacterium]|nr:ACP S-malonyltransferase [Candidatus Wallbacteria bacterium]